MLQTWGCFCACGGASESRRSEGRPAAHTGSFGESEANQGSQMEFLNSRILIIRYPPPFSETPERGKLGDPETEPTERILVTRIPGIRQTQEGSDLSGSLAFEVCQAIAASRDHFKNKAQLGPPYVRQCENS